MYVSIQKIGMIIGQVRFEDLIKKCGARVWKQIFTGEHNEALYNIFHILMGLWVNKVSE
jgi:hypothetical protein